MSTLGPHFVKLCMQHTTSLMLSRTAYHLPNPSVLVMFALVSSLPIWYTIAREQAPCYKRSLRSSAEVVLKQIRGWSPWLA
jgi:hypothetical protein